ncbi:MAG: phosphoglycolate phosphatase [Luteimonas sp.]
MPFPYQLVIFDLDGTLVNSALDIAEAVNRTFDDWHLPRVDQAVIRDWIGDGARVLLEHAFAHVSSDADIDRVLVEHAFAHVSSDADIDRVMPGFMVHYGDCLLLHARVYPGVREALAALHAQGVHTALCTNKPQRFLTPLLQAMGVAEYFEAMIGGDTLPQRKPDAEPLLHLARRFGVAAEACLMVGDSATDLHAAQAAKMDVALVSYGYARGFDVHSAGATAVVDDLRELLALG